MEFAPSLRAWGKVPSARQRHRVRRLTPTRSSTSGTRSMASVETLGDNSAPFAVGSIGSGERQCTPADCCASSPQLNPTIPTAPERSGTHANAGERSRTLASAALPPVSLQRSPAGLPPDPYCWHHQGCGRRGWPLLVPLPDKGTASRARRARRPNRAVLPAMLGSIEKTHPRGSTDRIVESRLVQVGEKGSPVSLARSGRA